MDQPLQRRAAVRADDDEVAVAFLRGAGHAGRGVAAFAHRAVRAHRALRRQCRSLGQQRLRARLDVLLVVLQRHQAGGHDVACEHGRTIVGQHVEEQHLGVLRLRQCQALVHGSPCHRVVVDNDHQASVHGSSFG